MQYLFLVGRILFVVLFLFSGPTALLNGAGVGCARAAGVPLPHVLVLLSGATSMFEGIDRWPLSIRP